jgi:hypothetical protein
LHGGTGKSVANSVGGFLPGDVLLSGNGATPEQIATHPHPFYTPIATFGSEYRMEPVAYGLKFAGALSGATFFQGDFTAQIQSTGVNAAAYAAKLPSGKVAVIVLNKDAEQEVEISLDFGNGKNGEVGFETMRAASLDSRETQIMWAKEPGRMKDGKYTVMIQHSTGICLTFK